MRTRTGGLVNAYAEQDRLKNVHRTTQPKKTEEYIPTGTG